MFTIEIHGKVNYSSPCARHEGVCGSRGTTPIILSLRIWSGWAFSFSPRPFKTLVSIERRWVRPRAV